MKKQLKKSLGLGVISVLTFSDYALASDHPALNPSKDAVVTYEVKMPEAPGKAEHQLNPVKVWFQKNGDRIRIDQIGGTHETVLDKVGQKVVLMDTQKKVYLPLQPKEGLKSPFLLDLSMDFKKEGERTIAGQQCTEWSIHSTAGRAKACVTETGVVLSQKGVDADGIKGEMIAKEVQYPTLTVADFETPKDYKLWTIQLQNNNATKANSPK